MAALLGLLDAYARDPAGGGEGLSAFAKTHLADALRQRPTLFSVLAFDRSQQMLPVGLVNCVEGFSTFACKPLVNVHDVVVLASHRGLRIGVLMLLEVERLLPASGVPANSHWRCCRVTTRRLRSTRGSVLKTTSLTHPWGMPVLCKSGWWVAIDLNSSGWASCFLQCRHELAQQAPRISAHTLRL